MSDDDKVRQTNPRRPLSGGYLFRERKGLASYFQEKYNACSALFPGTFSQALREALNNLSIEDVRHTLLFCLSDLSSSRKEYVHSSFLFENLQQ
jgi:hypothetical protein